MTKVLNEKDADFVWDGNTNVRVDLSACGMDEHVAVF
jgi:hypothetical protein